MRTQTQTTTDFAPIDALPPKGKVVAFGTLHKDDPFYVIYNGFDLKSYVKIDPCIVDGTSVNAKRVGEPSTGKSQYTHFNVDALVHIKN